MKDLENIYFNNILLQPCFAPLLMHWIMHTLLGIRLLPCYDRSQYEKKSAFRPRAWPRLARLGNSGWGPVHSQVNSRCDWLEVKGTNIPSPRNSRRPGSEASWTLTPPQTVCMYVCMYVCMEIKAQTWTKVTGAAHPNGANVVGGSDIDVPRDCDVLCEEVAVRVVQNLSDANMLHETYASQLALGQANIRDFERMSGIESSPQALSILIIHYSHIERTSLCGDRNIRTHRRSLGWI